MIVIREFGEGDSVEELTLLLNRAYAPLAQAGLKFVASWQTVAMTAERLRCGTCLLAHDGKHLVGTVVLHPAETTSECAYYNEPGVRYFGKFAVEPARQGEGIGRMLFDAVESRARAEGAEILACDTASPAARLIEMYQSWDMKIVAATNFAITNYSSVVLAKRLR